MFGNIPDKSDRLKIEASSEVEICSGSQKSLERFADQKLLAQEETSCFPEPVNTQVINFSIFKIRLCLVKIVVKNIYLNLVYSNKQVK